jgi:hypothetical protein
MLYSDCIFLCIVTNSLLEATLYEGNLYRNRKLLFHVSTQNIKQPGNNCELVLTLYT